MNVTAEPDDSPQKGRWLPNLLKLACSALLLVFLAHHYDFGRAFTQIGEISPGWFLLALVAAAGAILFGAIRWSWIMATLGYPQSWRTGLNLILIGLFFNQALPSNLGGDILRIWYVTKRAVPFRAAFSGIFFERSCGFLGLVLLVIPGLPHLFTMEGMGLVAPSIAALSFAVLGGYYAFMFADKASGLYRPILPVRAVDAIRALARDFRTAALDRRYGLPIFASSIVVQLFMVASMIALAEGLSMNIDPVLWLVIAPCAILATLIPLTFAGWGIREGTMIALLVPAGISPDTALALSVSYGFVFIASGLPGLAVWLSMKGQSGGTGTPNSDGA